MRFIPVYSSFSRLVAVAAAVFGLVGRSALLQAQSTEPTRSTKQRVYSETQAERGRLLFEGLCTDCHSPRMWGPDWNTKTVADIFDYVSMYMPEQAPGSLSAQEYRDIIAFFLKQNGLPAGQADLPDNPDVLKQIKMERN